MHLSSHNHPPLTLQLPLHTSFLLTHTFTQLAKHVPLLFLTRACVFCTVARELYDEAYEASRDFPENLFVDEDDAGWCAGEYNETNLCRFRQRHPGSPIPRDGYGGCNWY